MRVEYIVSRFPSPSETFIAREILALERWPEIEVGLRSLFPAKEGLIHPSAAPLVERVVRPSLGQGIAAIGWWLGRRPLRFLGSAGRIFAKHLHSPSHLVRALATVPTAAAHARGLAQHPVDHLHAHFATYPALSAWLCHRLTATPYSFTAHAHDLFVDQSMLGDKVHDASFVVAISEYNRRYLRDYGGDTATPVTVIRAGIDVDSYEFRPRTPPLSGPVRVLCVASLQEYKGHAVLLDALAGDEALERVELELIGSGPLHDELEERARQLGLAERVEFLGSRDETFVRERFAGADLFVLPSIVAADGQMEGLPVVLMEALASGVPTVATDLSAVGELIHDGVTGFLASPGDAGELSGALRRALSDSGRVDLASGRERIVRDFAVDESAQRLAEWFSGAAGRRASVPS